MPITLPTWQPEFLDRHRLPESYLAHAQKWFDPLVTSLATYQSTAGRPIMVAVNGSQGSGKTTLCDYLKASLAETYGLCTVALSLDDFYLTRQQRLELAESVHPLLATRGVPGTHDMPLMLATLHSLLQCDNGVALSIPRFDKSCDDRYPEQDYSSLYRLADQWVMLKAPSFDCVYRWRLEQEQRLMQSLAMEAERIMSASEISRFIQFFQRITLECLGYLPDRVHHLYLLDEHRQVTGYNEPGGSGV